MASILSEGVELGTNDNFSFQYVASHRRPAHAWLNVSIVTQDGDGGLDFNPYHVERLGEGRGTVVVPPPPILDAAMPYLLLAVATDNEEGRVPADVEQYIDWIDREAPPFIITGRRVNGQHVEATIRASKQWLGEYWHEGARDTRSPGQLEERLHALVDEALPEHHLPPTFFADVVEAYASDAMGDPDHKRRSTEDFACDRCVLGLTMAMSVGGLFIAMVLFARTRFPGRGRDNTFMLDALDRVFFDFHEYAINRPSIYGVPIAFADIANRVAIVASMVASSYRGVTQASAFARYLCEKRGDCAGTA